MSKTIHARNVPVLIWLDPLLDLITGYVLDMLFCVLLVFSIKCIQKIRTQLISHRILEGCKLLKNISFLFHVPIFFHNNSI